ALPIFAEPGQQLEELLELLLAHLAVAVGVDPPEHLLGVELAGEVAELALLLVVGPRRRGRRHQHAEQAQGTNHLAHPECLLDRELRDIATGEAALTAAPAGPAAGRSGPLASPAGAPPSTA